jgi:hypothetical protein
MRCLPGSPEGGTPAVPKQTLVIPVREVKTELAPR